MPRGSSRAIREAKRQRITLKESEKKGGARAKVAARIALRHLNKQMCGGKNQARGASGLGRLLVRFPAQQRKLLGHEREACRDRPLSPFDGLAKRKGAALRERFHFAPRYGQATGAPGRGAHA